jgi:hypothetical protein
MTLRYHHVFLDDEILEVDFLLYLDDLSTPPVTVLVANL